MKILETVQQVVQEQGALPYVPTEKQTFGELGLDSLDKLEMMMNLEELFGIDIEVEVIEKLQTLEDAVKLISDNLK